MLMLAIAARIFMTASLVPWCSSVLWFASGWLRQQIKNSFLGKALHKGEPLWLGGK
jgi:hypothetical protein